LIALPPPIYSNCCGMSNSKVERAIVPIIKKVAQKSGLGVVDNYSVLREKKLFTDGVHPNSEGSRIIAQQVYREIRKLEH
jgi:lysophospholipase L1-like esterase